MLFTDPVDAPFSETRALESVSVAVRLKFTRANVSVPGFISINEYPSVAPLVISYPQSLNVIVTLPLHRTSAVRVPNAPGIEKVMFANVVARLVVINAVFTSVAGFTTEITVPTAAVLMVMSCAEKVCSALNENVAWSLIVAAADGNR